jgi:hypothetical protein
VPARPVASALQLLTVNCQLSTVNYLMNAHSRP